ncbi:MAG: AIR synthase-related protein [Chloroflexi bacterium]|nr:AIR synthase-related protein [Chloroflexota bacterium]
MAHITGGGLIDNPPRIFPDGLGAKLHRGSWPLPPHLQSSSSKLGGIPEAEMHHVFNMGLGMLIVVAPRPGRTLPKKASALASIKLEKSSKGKKASQYGKLSTVHCKLSTVHAASLACSWDTSMISRNELRRVYILKQIAVSASMEDQLPFNIVGI